MKASYVALLVVIPVLLAGCGFGSMPSESLGTQSKQVTEIASSSTLVYVSDGNAGVVHVFDYKTGASVGKLTGFTKPGGECVDAKGDVFITDFARTSVDEYAHGGRKAISKLQTGGSPVACSVSPNGDLAVANAYTASGGGTIAVFKGATGKPTQYSDPSCNLIAAAGYDGKGNLFVQTQYSSNLCELPKGGKSMRTVSTDVQTNSPFGVMWDGKHITLADDYYTGSVTETIIYQMKQAPSGDLTRVGQTTLTYSECQNRDATYQPFIVGSENTPANKKLATAVVGSDSLCMNKMYKWAYPGGGDPTGSFKFSGHPSGQAVSIAQ